MLGWLERELSGAQVEEVAAVAAFGLAPLLSASEAMFENMRVLARTHRVTDMPRPMTSTRAFGDFIGFPEIEKIVERYAHSPSAPDA